MTIEMTDEELTTGLERDLVHFEVDAKTACEKLVTDLEDVARQLRAAYDQPGTTIEKVRRVMECKAYIDNRCQNAYEACLSFDIDDIEGAMGEHDDTLRELGELREEASSDGDVLHEG